MAEDTLLRDLMADPGFSALCKQLAADLDAGAPMTLGDIADYLGIPWDVFARELGAEIVRQTGLTVAVLDADEPGATFVRDARETLN